MSLLRKIATPLAACAVLSFSLMMVGCGEKPTTTTDTTTTGTDADAGTADATDDGAAGSVDRATGVEPTPADEN